MICAVYHAGKPDMPAPLQDTIAVFSVRPVFVHKTPRAAVTGDEARLASNAGRRTDQLKMKILP